MKFSTPGPSRPRAISRSISVSDSVRLAICSSFQRLVGVRFKKLVNEGVTRFLREALRPRENLISIRRLRSGRLSPLRPINLAVHLLQHRGGYLLYLRAKLIPNLPCNPLAAYRDRPFQDGDGLLHLRQIGGYARVLRLDGLISQTVVVRLSNTRQ